MHAPLLANLVLHLVTSETCVTVYDAVETLIILNFNYWGGGGGMVTVEGIKDIRLLILKH